MMTGTPFISVIVPTYNYGNFIIQAVDSVLRQDYPSDKIELIVVDARSTDNTGEIIRQYGEQVMYVCERVPGIAAARNRGIALARGEIITFLDADDIWIPIRIRKVADIFRSRHDIGIVCHNFDVIDTDGEILYENYYETFRHGTQRTDVVLSDIINGKVFCGGSSFSFKATLLKEIFPVPGDIKRGVDFYLTVVASCHTGAVYTPEILGAYRLHQSNTTTFINADPVKLAETHKDFSHTYKTLLTRLSSEQSARQEDLKALRRIQHRSSFFSSLLSGKRYDAIKQWPAMFKSSESARALLSTSGLILLLFMPKEFYAYMIRFYYFFKKQTGRIGSTARNIHEKTGDNRQR